ncbi:hypothetical protein R3P38DRAFT_2833434 [Favolaschia claudopus]|uniref:F-box domain-containing protein n=1 Tax=Favolaschia claudopus TaxID=2862362 RepID=A0AAW0EEL7_9AGAR
MFILRAIYSSGKQAFRMSEAQPIADANDLNESTSDSSCPISNLPTEIMVDIFLYCLADDGESTYINFQQPPFLLTHVCSRWREISIHMPALWTTFHVEGTIAALPCLPQVAETWTERSRGSILSIRIRTLEMNVDILPTLEVLGRHSPRIRALEIYSPNTKNFSGMHQFIKGDLWSLQNLSLLFLTTDVPDEEFSVYLPGVGMPLLREFMLNGIPPVFLTFPWAQLTNFTGELFTAEQCLYALRQMPNLTVCALAPLRLSTHFGIGTYEISTHPNIRHFTLFDLSSVTWGNLMSSITLPSLQILEFRCVAIDNLMFHDFFSRSASPLQKLSMRPPGLWPAHLSLRSPFTASGLTHIEIWDPSKKLVAKFSESLATQADFLRHLQHLSFPTGCPQPPFSTSILEIARLSGPAIAARRHLVLPGCALFESFRVTSSDNDCSETMFSSADLVLFRALKASGIGTESVSFV